jgi:hypothetical protein
VSVRISQLIPNVNTGLVHVILFVTTRRLLPPRSMIPKFLISNPRAILTSTTLPDVESDNYYDDDAESKHSWYPHSIDEAKDGANPFSDYPAAQPAYPAAAVIRRVHSPDSSRSSSCDSSSRSSYYVQEDYDVLRAVSLLSLGPPFQVGEAEVDELAEGISPAPTHREGELPQFPASAYLPA